MSLFDSSEHDDIANTPASDRFFDTFTSPQGGVEHSPAPSNGSLQNSESPKIDLTTIRDVLPEDETSIAGYPPMASTIRGIYPPNLVYPKSRYQSCDLPVLPMSKEESVVAELAKEHNRIRVASLAEGTQGRDEFIEFDLTDFSIYLPGTNTHHPFELRSLHTLTSRCHAKFLFDGILSFGNSRNYVEGVPFGICSIGNYGTEDLDSTETEVWLQSDFNAKSRIFYRLRRPASEYIRYHEAFLWTARLSNLFFDYTRDRPSLSVHNFRSDFYRWASQKYGHFKQFQAWHREYGSEDFRGHISTNIEFLYNEAVGLDRTLQKLMIWRELLDAKAVPLQKIKTAETIVTPYIYDLWSHLPFGHHLKAVARVGADDAYIKTQHNPATCTAREDPTKNLSSTSSAEDDFLQTRPDVANIRIGDVLAVTKDLQPIWKDEISKWKVADDCWYICVSAIHIDNNGFRTFDGNWLYRPSDTSCAKMKYLHHNELFISNNCTCRLNDSRSIAEDEILEVVPLVWHGKPTDPSVKFCRQAYLDNERFVTLKEEHKVCSHLRKSQDSASSTEYHPGQTVLAFAPGSKRSGFLEPYEVIRYYDEGSKRYAVLRRLLRRCVMDKSSRCRPNELVYTEQFDIMLAKRVKRPCLVRFYTESDVTNKTIPTPYDRDGTGNAFYITKRLVEAKDEFELRPIEEDMPTSLIMSFDPSAPPAKDVLKGLDLFSGWGSFGRGLEEGGVLKNEWAVDIYDAAIHSYRANLDDPTGAKLFYGSVDDLLHQALLGNPEGSSLIPLKGEVHFICAGSPCQGFSLLNDRKGNEKGLKNQSLVASVAAYVDFYRPKYGVLENVVSMSNQDREHDVLSQLICSLVGMGYQVQQPMLMDAWSYGSAQSRSRLFICFAAPGLEPMIQPEQSHAHYPGLSGRNRAIGKLANGAAFGERVYGPTPFDYPRARDVCADLPATDGACMHVRYPDHIPARVLTERHRQQIAVIPKRPRGMNYFKAWNEGHGVMTPEHRLLFPGTAPGTKARASTSRESKAWGRIHPDHLFKTVIVCQRCEDARMGTVLHWEESRELTILEVRRAQSVPDHEVLVGLPRARWKLIGNGVDRKVALALSLSLRDAWLKSTPGAGRFPILDEVANDGCTISSIQSATTSLSIRKNKRVIEDSDDDSDDELASSLNVPNIFSSRSVTDSMTSATDSATEEELLSSLKRDRKGKLATRITKRTKRSKLSHRLASALTFESEETLETAEKTYLGNETELLPVEAQDLRRMAIVDPFSKESSSEDTLEDERVPRSSLERRERPTETIACRLKSKNRPQVIIDTTNIAREDYITVEDVDDANEEIDEDTIFVEIPDSDVDETDIDSP